MTKTRQWTIGAVLAIALILVAGFMLLVQPQRSEAASLQEQTVSQEEAAVALQSKLAQLKAQQKDLPRQQARLAEIRTRLPETPALPSLIRSLSVAADTAGAELVTLAPSAPIDLSGSQQSGAPAGSVQPNAASTGAASPGSASAAVTKTALKEIPVRIEVAGSYAALTQFLTQIEGLQRSMLVTDVGISKEGADGADTLTLSLGASVFMTSEQAAVAATATVQTPVAADATTTE